MPAQKPSKHDQKKASPLARRMRWEKYPGAEQYLKSKRVKYQALDLKDRKQWMSQVQEHVITNWDMGPAGDIRKVCPLL